MDKLSNSIHGVVFFCLILVLPSCVSFKPGWDDVSEKSSSDNVEKLLQEAYTIESNASSGDSLLLLIEAFKKVEQADPTNYEALWNIGNYSILMGAAYTEKTKDKKAYYKEAVKYCEKALCTNEVFATKVKQVKNVTDAVDVLSINEIDAMGNWYTARFYYFKECLKPIGRLVNTKIVIQNNSMIERIDDLDSNWFGGCNYFSRALYYIATPENFGGSKERARDEFSKAIEVGPDFIIHRWGRAKYLYDLTGNKEGYKADLEWVLSQDPRNAGNTYPWNVYIQNDAQKMLDNMKK